MTSFHGVEISTTVDEKFRLIIPNELIQAKGIKKFVELVNSEENGHLITRVYYHKSGIKEALEVKVKRNSESKKGSYRVTLIRSIRKRSDSFSNGRQVLIVDRGEYLEILPWSDC